MPRSKTLKLLNGLRELGHTDKEILEHILFNHLSGSAAEYCMLSAQEEFVPDTIDEDGYNHLTS